MKAQHPWVLVGPWYRDDSIGGPPANKTTAPIFQKYADGNFVNKFLEEPQKSLRFVCEDFVDRLCIDPNKVVTPALRSKYDDSLKLFLDTHSRYYLVVCELHCVVPGFPSADRKQVCETGFVIRRKVPVIDKSLQLEMARLVRRRNQLKAEVLKLENKHSKKESAYGVLKKAKQKAVGTNISELDDKRRHKVQADLDTSIDQLNAFIAKNNLKSKLQGWVPTETDNVGNWQEVEQNSETISEKVFPLYPLIADPTVRDHSGTKKSIWFGIVPTGGSEIDSQGNPQFDDSDLYHAQCFVRRKKECCDGKGRNCCHGELVWSEPTTSYKIASFYDLDGGSHRPINIKLPDLNALKDQANLGPRGRGANVKMIAPAESGLVFATDGMDMPSVNDNELVRTGQQICFFAFFLFFIVAFFLFRLFLPILLFLFQLWFLLKLKLCIPPTISLDIDIAADLEIKGPDIELEFDLALGAEVEFGGQLFSSKEDLQKELAKGIASELGAGGSNFNSDLLDKLKDPFNSNGLSLNEIADIYISMATDFSEEPQAGAPTGQIPLPEDGLVYFDKVKVA